jgi:hypothetical protein
VRILHDKVERLVVTLGVDCPKPRLTRVSRRPASDPVS